MTEHPLDKIGIVTRSFSGFGGEKQPLDVRDWTDCSQEERIMLVEHLREEGFRIVCFGRPMDEIPHIRLFLRNHTYGPLIRELAEMDGVGWTVYEPRIETTPERMKRLNKATASTPGVHIPWPLGDVFVNKEHLLETFADEVCTLLEVPRTVNGYEQVIIKLERMTGRSL